MRYVNIIHLRVFCSPEEDKEKIEKTFMSLIDYNSIELETEKLKIVKTVAAGFNHKEILILKMSLEKERHCNRFLKHLNGHISKNDKESIKSQMNRLDDNMNFFIRLDKKSLLEGKYILTDSGDCFHISMNMNAHPRKKEVAFEIVKEIFGKEQ
jgi:RNA binding exosome subunit